MKLFSWNVNGIRAAYKKGFLNWIEKENPDILCVQETKAHKEQLTEELKNVKGYFTYFSTPEKKGYSGVALFSKVEPESVEFNLGNEKFDREGRVIKAKFKDFTLFNIYFPNGGMSAERLKYKLEFYEEILLIFKELLDKGEKVIVCGDVNTAHTEIDLARPKDNSKVTGFLPIEREWIDRLLGIGFVDSFRMFNSEGDNYTYWNMQTRARDRNVGWRIDYFFISENLKKNVSSAKIYSEVMGSDHCPIELNIKF
jgi:exodeoxyribonuclease-3